MNVTKMYMFLFAIITAVIGSTEQENRLANTCWKVSWNRRNHKGKLIGIEKIDSTGHLSKPSNLLAVVSHNDAWAHIPKIFADYDGKSPTVIYNKHVIKNINDVIGHYDRHNKIVWEKSWWQFTTWERVDCPTPNTINHNNIDLTIGNRLIKTEEGKAKDANDWTGKFQWKEIPEFGKILESSSSVDGNETNNPEDKKYIIKERIEEKKQCCNIV